MEGSIQDSLLAPGSSVGLSGEGVAPQGGARSPYLTIGNNSNKLEERGPESAPENREKQWVSGIQKRKATVLRIEVLDMIEKHGIDSVVTWTLSLSEFLNRDEMERRFHSLQTRKFKKIFKCGVHVVERAPRTGRLHLHGACVMRNGEDVRTGFDFDKYEEWRRENEKGREANLGRKKALSRAFAKDATSALRDLWKEFSPDKMKRYGFGQAHLVPVRKNGEAFAFYMAKYLSKVDDDNAWKYRHEDKGKRSYRVWGKGRVCSIHHSPNTVQSWKWRRRVEFAGKVLGENFGNGPWSHEDFTNNCGPRWCFHLKPWITGIPMNYIKWRTETFSFNEAKAFTMMDGFKAGIANEQRLIDEYVSFFRDD
tara:strand:+ start:100 stop:1200 length:1101 start_codon:yes stop_codon:yes gene_type:complete